MVAPRVLRGPEGRKEGGTRRRRENVETPCWLTNARMRKGLFGPQTDVRGPALALHIYSEYRFKASLTGLPLKGAAGRVATFDLLSISC